MSKVMKCKRCGKTDNPGEVNLSVYQNTFNQFPKGQYVFLCLDCVRILRKPCPMITEPYTESGTYEEFQDRMNQEVRF